jgi:hypothetical protein
MYEEFEQGGPVRRWVRLDHLRLLGVEELIEMAEAADLDAEVLAGSYDLDPIVDHDERAILVARRRGRTGPASLL